MQKIRHLFFIMFFALIVTGAFGILAGCAEEKITYTVSFQAGDFAVESIVYDPESGYYRIPEDPTRDGYVFLGWYTDAECTESFDFSQAISCDTVLYAKWVKVEDKTEEKAQVDVIFNGNGATGGEMENLRSAADEIVVLPLNAYVREGYRFIGWGKSESDGVKHTDGGYYYVSVEQEQLLYAKWSANSYFITFDRDGGKSGNDYVKATYGSELLAISTPTKEGYVFDGYYTEKSGCGICYYDKDGNGVDVWNIAGDVTLYAHWKSAAPNGVFDGNSAVD